MKYIAFFLFTLLNISGLIAGQGIFLQLNNYLDDNVTITARSSQCIQNPENISLIKLGKHQNIYLEASNNLFDGCVFKSAWLDFDIYSIVSNNKKLISSHRVVISHQSGSKAINQYASPNFQITNQTYLHNNLFGDQDIINISISKKMDHWMASIQNNISNKSLNKIFLPGTHDSGTYNITNQSEFTEDCNSTIRNFGSIAKSIIKNWSKTQYQDIATQLNHGIRYFDLRLCGDNSDLYICHSLQSDNLIDIIKQFKNYLLQTGHEYEIIILDLNHWYPIPGYTEEQIVDYALTLIKKELSPWIASREYFSPTSQLENFWLQKKQVIIASSVIPDQDEFSYVWYSVNTSNIADCDNPYTDLCSIWPNKQTKDELINAIGENITAFQNSTDYLKILQLIATPGKRTIIDAIINPIQNPDNLTKFTKTYKFDVTHTMRQLDVNKLNSGLILIEDFSNGLDLTQLTINKNI